MCFWEKTMAKNKDKSETVKEVIKEVEFRTPSKKDDPSHLKKKIDKALKEKQKKEKDKKKESSVKRKEIIKRVASLLKNN